MNLMKYAFAGGKRYDYTQISKITPTGTDAMTFGISINSSGDTIAVSGQIPQGAYDTNNGFVDIYRLISNTWTYITRLMSNEEVTIFANGFGTSVSIHGTYSTGRYMAIGAPYESRTYMYYCPAYTDNWTLQKTFDSPVSAMFNDFGISVHTDGNMVAIGTPGDDTDGAGTGSVYIYNRSGTNWTFSDRLTLTTPQQTAEYGFNVVSNVGMNYLAVGAPGINCIDIFTRVGNNWTLAHTIEPTGEFPALIGVGRYNMSMSSDGTLVVGTGNAVALVYERVSSTWVETNRLRYFRSATPPPFTYFGHRVCISSDAKTILVSATRDVRGDGVTAGAVYTYNKGVTTYRNGRIIESLDSVQDSYFGSGIATTSDNGLTLITSQVPPNGALYFFER